MTHPVSLASIFLKSLLAGMRSFGAVAAPDAIRRSMSGKPGEAQTSPLDAGLDFLRLTPGGTPAQLCGYAGLSLRGVPGALAAFLGFCLPGFLVMTALGVLSPSFAALTGAQPVLEGLRAVAPAVCLLAGIGLLRPHVRTGLLLALACGAGALFFIGLKPFSMLLGGAVLGVLLLKEPEGLPSPPAMLPYGWRLPVSLFLLYGACAAFFFLLDPLLGKLFLSVGKAEAWSLGGFGAFPLFFADSVRTRHWIDAPSFAALTALAQAVPGPALCISAFVAYQVKGLAGATAALLGMFTTSFLILLAAAPARQAIVSCAWARQAVLGVTAVLGGMVLALAARFAADVTWDVPRGILTLAAAAALALRVNPLWVVLGGAGAGYFLL